MRTKSSGSSSRRFPALSTASSQTGPTTASKTWHWPTSSRTRCGGNPRPEESNPRRGTRSLHPALRPAGRRFARRCRDCRRDGTKQKRSDSSALCLGCGEHQKPVMTRNDGPRTIELTPGLQEASIASSLAQLGGDERPNVVPHTHLESVRVKATDQFVQPRGDQETEQTH